MAVAKTAYSSKLNVSLLLTQNYHMTSDMHHFYDISLVFCILIHFNWMENNDYS